MTAITQKLTFKGHSGADLAARLDLPNGPIRAYALFAHCFTCSKDLLAARRIAAELARAGIAVLRFDFTGLGSSEGEFASTNFSTNLEDLLSATAFLEKHYEAPSVLIGHSLGGAAILAIAGRLPSVKAVATIGAPSDTAHVLKNLGTSLEDIQQGGEAEVSLAGRAFRVKKQFVEDVRSHRILDAVAGMRKPLLILHAPLDEIVGIDNATQIFLAAKHPKSYISLDQGDHLLTNTEDATFAASAIGGWLSRYLPGDEAQGAVSIEHVRVRSGVLTSVHAFATDPARGVFILGILVLFIGGSLALFAWRAATLAPGGLFQPISREGALVLNNLVLTTATATVLIGTLYPLLVEAVTGDKISVGAPFFNLTFGPLILPLLVIVPFGPLLAWKRGDLWAVSQRLFGAFGAALAVALLAFVLVDRASVLAALGIGLGVWLVLGALTDLVVKSGFGKAVPSVVFSRFKGLPRSVFGTALAHAGIGLTTIGIISVTTLETERIAAMQPGETVQIQGYNLRFDSLRPFTGPNYTEDQATFVLSRVTGKPLGEVVSSKRLYTARQMPTTEAGIRTLGLSQLYVSLGDQTPNGKIVVRIWWKPMVTLIWLGALVMMVGGTVSLLDRRLRVGAPMPRRKPAVEGRVA